MKGKTFLILFFFVVFILIFLITFFLKTSNGSSSNNNFLEINNNYPKFVFVSDIDGYKISIKDKTQLEIWLKKTGYQGFASDLAVISAISDQPDGWVYPKIIAIHFTDRPQLSTHINGLLPNNQEGLIFSLYDEYDEKNQTLAIFIQTPFLEENSQQTLDFDMERTAEINLLTAIHTLVNYSPKMLGTQRMQEFNKILEEYSGSNSLGSLFLTFE